MRRALLLTACLSMALPGTGRADPAQALEAAPRRAAPEGWTPPERALAEVQVQLDRPGSERDDAATTPTAARAAARPRTLDLSDFWFIGVFR